MRNKLLRLFYEKGFFRLAIKIYYLLLSISGLISIYELLQKNFFSSLFYAFLTLLCIYFIKLLKNKEEIERSKVYNETIYQKEENEKIIEMWLLLF